MAVAPPPEWGAIPTPPRRNGGNMDNKELVAGKTVYLPVFTEGALFSGAIDTARRLFLEVPMMLEEG
jgi:acetamidase/formamidase